jgi:hypothetical protein
MNRKAYADAIEISAGPHVNPPSFAMRREVSPCSYHIATSLKQIPSNKGNGWQQIFNQAHAFMQK